MRPRQSQAWVRAGVRGAKEKRPFLAQSLPDQRPMLTTFVGHFLDQLGEEDVTTQAVVHKFMFTTAHLTSPKTFALYPRSVPRELVLLSDHVKRSFFWRFPEIASALFPPDLAVALIREFEQERAAWDVLAAERSSRRSQVKS